MRIVCAYYGKCNSRCRAGWGGTLLSRRFRLLKTQDSSLPIVGGPPALARDRCPESETAAESTLSGALLRKMALQN